MLATKRKTRIHATLVNGMRLEFKNYFRYQKRDGGTLVFRELVAEYDPFRRRNSIREIDDTILQYVDDFLLLSSFASRRRCVCVGWDFGSSTIFKQCYRCNVSIPKDTVDFDIQETLIDLSHFEEFIASTYKRFNSYERLESLRYAMHLANQNPNVTSDRIFLSIYSAIETLIYDFRQRKNLELVIPDERDWKKLKTKIKEVISPILRENENLNADSSRREYLYQKLDELNRIGFGTAVKQFCIDYSVDLADLWPLTGRASLTDIRNKLVHGYTFSYEEQTIMTSAYENLRWTAERMLLAILGWPVSKSRAGNAFLDSYSIFYKSWKADQKALDSLMQSQPSLE